MIYAKEASKKARSYSPLARMTEDSELLFSCNYYEHLLSVGIVDAAANGHFSAFMEISTDNQSEIINHLTDFLFFHEYKFEVLVVNSRVFLSVNWGHMI